MTQGQPVTLATRATDGSKADYVAQMTMGEAYRDLLPWINLAIIIMGWFSVSMEVFLRRSFGERYLNLIRVFLAMLALSFVTFSGQVLALFQLGTSSAGEGASWLGVYGLQLVYYAFLLASLFHLVHIWWRGRRGERWYSRSFGISNLSFLIGRRIGFGPVSIHIDDWFLYRFIEPAFVWFISFLSGAVAPALGFFFFVASVTMFIKNNYLYSQERGRLLDMMDAQIEQDYFTAAFEGADKQQTAGFSLVRAIYAAEGDGIPDSTQPIALTSDGQRDFSAALADVLGPPQPLDLSTKEHDSSVQQRG